jgi:DNA-binding NarL/FixJ family response regulator
VEVEQVAAGVVDQATRRLAGPGVEHPIDVIVVTTFDLDDYVFGALRAGAAGFLLKDASPETLTAAIKLWPTDTASSPPK